MAEFTPNPEVRHGIPWCRLECRVGNFPRCVEATVSGACAPAIRENQAQLARAREVLELPLLFYSGGEPNPDRWEKITGTREMTTKVMGDTVRATLRKKKESTDV